MKRILIIGLVASLSILIASSFTPRFSHHPEDKVVTSEWYVTPDLDQVHFGPGCDATVDGNSCYKPTIMSLPATNEHWVFEGEPTLECENGVPQNSSAQWNHLDRAWQTLIAEKRISVLLNNPDLIKVRLITGSGPIKLRLSCIERYHE